MEGVETLTLMVVPPQSGKVLADLKGIINDFDAVVEGLRKVLKKQ